MLLTVSLVTLRQLAIETIAQNILTGHPDLGNSSLRFSFQVNLGCGKLAFKINCHGEIEWVTFLCKASKLLFLEKNVSAEN